MYEKKLEVEPRLKKTLTFPYTVTNFNRVEATVNTMEELTEHLMCREKLKPLTLILNAKLHPSIFTENGSYLPILKLYSRQKQYGISFIYNNMGEIPNKTMEALELIQATIDGIQNARPED